jgi:hypothetical protein
MSTWYEMFGDLPQVIIDTVYAIVLLEIYLGSQLSLQAPQLVKP